MTAPVRRGDLFALIWMTFRLTGFCFGRYSEILDYHNVGDDSGQTPSNEEYNHDHMNGN
jgi:hypothetical protein